MAPRAGGTPEPFPPCPRPQRVVCDPAPAPPARRLLPLWGAVWFALLLGCSDRLLFHCCEAKPYAVDVLVAVGLLATFVRRRGEGDAALCRQLLLYAALSPLLVFLSFPACFLL